MQKPVTEKKKYFVVRERAVPEVLLKVVEAKKLLDSGKVDTVQDAAERTGISRSSFYKYKDDIFPFHEETRGKTITFIIQMDDEPADDCTVSWKHSHHSSEYSYQWDCHTYSECGHSSGRGGCRSNGRDD